MASWSLLEAASGFFYDAAAGAIRFAPVISPERFRAPFVARDGWGTVEQTIEDGRLTLRLRPVAGSLTVSSVRLRPPSPARECTVSLDSRPFNTRLVGTDGGATVALAEPATIDSGQTLEIKLTG
jgi:hypothetical protein